MRSILAMYICTYICMCLSCLGMSISFWDIMNNIYLMKEGVGGVSQLEGVHMEESSADGWRLRKQKPIHKPGSPVSFII